MDLKTYKASLEKETPPDELPLALQALWHDANGDWEAAHDLAQAQNDETGAWIHAYLHRKEGDTSNAAYWYRRAGKPEADGPLDQEWEAIVQETLASADR